MNPGVVDQRSSSEEKIRIFRSLFRGREDVYPRRFESRKTGRAGYAPACANEWVRGVCEKPRIKCAECPNRRFLPVTDDVIRWHLSGRDPEDVIESLHNGRSPLVLTERNEHLDRLERGLAENVRHLVALRAGLGKKQRQAIADRLASIPGDEPRVILATGKYLGEGFDDSRLDTLFLTLPVSWRGTIAQYAGRLHRLHDGKREVRVYDYADLNVPMLARMFDRRCRGYEAIGYTVLLPASAIPGWPADVVLPSDPVWKRDYSGSVRRLVRDGVDSPLASLFVHVARAVPPDADGAQRARSASEAFLFRRLETLAITKSRFAVNTKLPIPFDGAGSLEVDLLCADARVAVELDGAQHLADRAAYRRDRRKDRLLQESGYLVLRFLAEDLGRDLDAVLDAILRALSHRASSGSVPLQFLRGGRT